MIEARHSHASCAVGLQIFVFGGSNDEGQLSSVEVLDLKLQESGLDQAKGWQLLQVSNLEAKYFPAMTAISASEFVIIGGQNACV